MTGTVVRTNRFGEAMCAWRLGASSGANTLVASLQGVGSVTFTAISRMPAVVASFDLETIGGKALPLTYSGGGETWTIVGGHYVLLDDGSYLFGYVTSRGVSNAGGRDSVMSAGLFTQAGSVVSFFLAAGSYPASSFYMERDGLFATGKIDEDRLSMAYEDFLDFDPETYVRTPAARP